MSYWDRPFFPEWCGDAILDDHVTYDTMVRIAGSFSGISQTFKAVADMHGWTHIVLLSDDDTSNICWYGSKPFDEVFGQNENYTFTWLRLGSEPTDEQLDDILQQIQSLTRGLWLCCYFCECNILYFRDFSELLSVSILYTNITTMAAYLGYTLRMKTLFRAACDRRSY